MDIVTTFETLDATAVHDFITRRQEEHLFLDFKTVKSAELRERNDRKSLAIALSGFANSSGGLVVWGVDARKNPDGIDCAQAASEIPNVKQLVSRLNELTGEGAAPLVDGVRHRAIPTSGDAGFAGTLVPESLTGPHMAKLGEDRFYKRSGDSFYRMEPFDIADMYGRRRRPSLCLQVRVAPDGGITSGTTEKRNVKIVLSIANIGRAIARAPYLAFNLPPTASLATGVDGSGSIGLRRIPIASEVPSVRYGGSADAVIHPGTALDVTALTMRLRMEGGRLTSPLSDLRIDYGMAAEDVPLFEGNHTVTASEILRGAGLGHLAD